VDLPALQGGRRVTPQVELLVALRAVAQAVRLGAPLEETLGGRRVAPQVELLVALRAVAQVGRQVVPLEETLEAL